jgi:hypothetical protein
MSTSWNLDLMPLVANKALSSARQRPRETANGEGRPLSDVKLAQGDKLTYRYHPQHPRASVGAAVGQTCLGFHCKLSDDTTDHSRVSVRIKIKKLIAPS